MAEKKEEMMEEVLEDLEKDAAEKQAEEVSEAEETEAETEAAESGEQAEETEESEAEDGQEAPADEKKGFFKKKKDKKDEQIEELNDKRTEKEKTQMYDMGAKSIIEKILPVIDNFERGLAAVPEEQREDAFVVGMDKVYRQMLTELDASGVKPIEAVGQEFDPNFHNAVMQVESEEYDSGVVAQELQKGYMYKDSVVRHSMVAVVS